MSLSYSKNEDTAADYQGKKEKDSRPKTM